MNRAEKSAFIGERMKGSLAKKLRKIVKKDTKENFNEFAETINKSSLKTRIKIAFRIIAGKL